MFLPKLTKAESELNREIAKLTNPINERPWTKFCFSKPWRVERCINLKDTVGNMYLVKNVGEVPITQVPGKGWTAIGDETKTYVFLVRYQVCIHEDQMETPPFKIGVVKILENKSTATYPWIPRGTTNTCLVKIKPGKEYFKIGERDDKAVNIYRSGYVEIIFFYESTV